MKHSNTQKRLLQSMEEQNIRQVDILNLAKPYCEKYNIKLNKSDLSQYISGKTEPNQDKLYVLAKALNVNEAWLMGFDVPPERADYGKISDEDRELLKETDALIDAEALKLGAASKQNPISPEKSREITLLMGYRYLDETDKGIILGEIRQMLRSDKYKNTDFTL